MNDDEIISKHNIRSTIGTRNELVAEIKLCMEKARQDEREVIANDMLTEVNSKEWKDKAEKQLLPKLRPFFEQVRSETIKEERAKAQRLVECIEDFLNRKHDDMYTHAWQRHFKKALEEYKKARF